MYHLTLAGKVNTNRGLLCTCTCQLQLMLRFGFGSASCRVCHTIRSRSLMACHLENNPTWEVPPARFIYLLLGTRPRFRPSNINKGLNLYSQYSNSRHVWWWCVKASSCTRMHYSKKDGWHVRFLSSKNVRRLDPHTLRLPCYRLSDLQKHTSFNFKRRHIACRPDHPAAS